MTKEMGKIPFYEHEDWKSLPSMKVYLNSQEVTAYGTWTRKDWIIHWNSIQAKWMQGTWNGQKYLFRITKGKGKGDFLRHYAYFRVGMKQYFIHLGDHFPPELHLSTEA